RAPSPAAHEAGACRQRKNRGGPEHQDSSGHPRAGRSGHRVTARNMTDYAATMRDFRLEVPARFNWAFDTFDAWARDPSKLALLWVSADGQPRRFTFAELSERSKRFANALAGIGIKPGERVVVMLPRVYQWWEILLGCLR